MKWLFGILVSAFGIAAPATYVAPTPVVQDIVPIEQSASTPIPEITKGENGVKKILPYFFTTPNGQKIVLEWTTTPETRERGLSGRTGIDFGKGMMFDFRGEPRGSGIWMKDMLFSIDVVWLSDDFEIVGMVPNMTPETYPHVFRVPQNGRYALELAAGSIKKFDLKIGNFFSF